MFLASSKSAENILKIVMNMQRRRREKHLQIKLNDGNQVEDKIVWGLGERFLRIHLNFVC
jgi:hypothetical protein